MSYRVVKLDTGVVADRVRLIEEALPISAIHVIGVPVGAQVDLAIGAGPAFSAFAGFTADLCPVEMGGLFATNAAVTPGEMEIIVWLGGGSSQGPL